MRSRNLCLSPDTGRRGDYAISPPDINVFGECDIARLSMAVDVRMLFGTASRTVQAFDTPSMRLAAASLLAICVAVALAPTAGAAGPTLRVVPGPSLAVQGAGFVPQTLVRLRLTGSGHVLRVVLVRAGTRGGFLVRFPALERCSPSLITATGTRERQARVPAAWFVRECPPPPPLDPATPPPPPLDPAAPPVY
jgi:hypothetical protein